jgi:hypothetical protein
MQRMRSVSSKSGYFRYRPSAVATDRRLPGSPMVATMLSRRYNWHVLGGHKRFAGDPHGIPAGTQCPTLSKLRIVPRLIPLTRFRAAAILR